MSAAAARTTRSSSRRFRSRPRPGNGCSSGPAPTRPPSATRLIRGARAAAAELDASSLHVLFPTDPERELLDREGFLTRKSCQFHWHNDGYADFDDFLARFSSAKRKKAKRERRRVAEAEIVFEHLRGDEPTRAEWDAIFQFYSHTFERRGRPPYLNREFFAEIATTMPENLVIVLARYRGAPIAAAICFRGGATLYGRYWGSVADFHSLHFETCYYQGIEYCIRERLQKFEPGTQGEHKISRGFTPSATWSCHWLRDRGLPRRGRGFPAARNAPRRRVHGRARRARAVSRRSAAPRPRGTRAARADSR